MILIDGMKLWVDKRKQNDMPKMMPKTEKELYKVDIHHLIKTIMFKFNIR